MDFSFEWRSLSHANVFCVHFFSFGLYSRFVPDSITPWTPIWRPTNILIPDF